MNTFEFIRETNGFTITINGHTYYRSGAMIDINSEGDEIKVVVGGASNNPLDIRIIPGVDIVKTGPTKVVFAGTQEELLTTLKNDFLFKVANATGGAVSEGDSTVFDYYIDTVAGRDTNNGTTKETPKKTYASVASVLTAGKKVGIKRGSVLRELVNIVPINTTIGAYGVGDRPKILASNPVAKASVTKTAAQVNVYQFTATPSTLGGSTYPFEVFENGQRLRRATSIADCDAKVGSMYVAGITNGVAQTIYIHAIGSTNPATDGKAYEVTVRDACIDTGATGLKISEIDCYYGNQNDGVARFGGTGAVITNCDFYEGTKHTCFTSDNNVFNNCRAIGTLGIDCMWIYYTPSGLNTLGVTWNDCQAIGRFAYLDEATRYPTSSGWMAHVGAAAPKLNKMTINNCYAENLVSGFGGDVTELNIINCRSYLVATAVGSAGYGAGSVVNIKRGFFDQRIGDTYKRASNAQRNLVNIGGVTNVEGCVFVLTRQNWGSFVQAAGESTINLIQNTFAVTGGAADFNGVAKQGAGLLTMTRNIFYGVREITTADSITNLNVSANYNVYWRTSNTSFIQWKEAGVTYATLADWQAHGEDVNGAIEDPQFTILPIDWVSRFDAQVANPSVQTKQAGASFYPET